MGMVRKSHRVPGRPKRVVRALHSILPASLAFLAAVSHADSTHAFQQQQDSRAPSGKGSALVEIDIFAMRSTPAMARNRRDRERGSRATSARPIRLRAMSRPPRTRLSSQRSRSQNQSQSRSQSQSQRGSTPIELDILRDALYAWDPERSSRPRPRLTYELDAADSSPAIVPASAAASQTAPGTEPSDVKSPAPAPAAAAASPPLPDPDSLVVPCGDVIPPPSGTYPIDLATALRLADSANPTIGAARTLILEALALQLEARTLLLPSLNGGASYHGHNGVLERSSGKIINVSLQSLYLGAGASVFVAGTVNIPGVNVSTPLTDAWFEPLAARQRLAGTRFAAQATTLDILLDVAVLHVELLGNQSILEVQRRSEVEFQEVYRLTKNYAEAGEGREADAHRR